MFIKNLLNNTIKYIMRSKNKKDVKRKSTKKNKKEDMNWIVMEIISEYKGFSLFGCDCGKPEKTIINIRGIYNTHKQASNKQESLENLYCKRRKKYKYGTNRLKEEVIIQGPFDINNDYVSNKITI